MIQTNKDLVKEIIGGEKGILPTTNTTSTTFTTKLIDNWGYIDLKECILLEQLSKLEYIYNFKGEIGLVSLSFDCPSCGTRIKVDKEKIRCNCGRMLDKDCRGLQIKDKTFYLKCKPQEPLYLTPSIEDINSLLLEGVPNTPNLFEEITTSLNTLFDFNRQEDAKVCCLYVLFSYVLPHFNSAFNLGIDATKGSGKTTLLEILSFLVRHGFLADVSSAAIPRLKQKYDLNIFVDEIDQLKNFEDVQGLIRKGQRRGNKYVRLNKNSLEEEIFEAFGLYAYSFRSQLEDAFKSRSMLIRTARCKDSRLSIINTNKAEILKPLFNKIFFWYVNNIFVFGSRSSEVVEVVGTFTRDTLYNTLTSNFTPQEQELISNLAGRNSEIGYLFLQACKFLGLDLTQDITKIMSEKQEEEETPDDYYLDIIKQIFESEIKNNSDWLLTKGEFAGYRYYPKTKFYMRLVSELKGHNLLGIGTPKYNSLLKDISFQTNYNIKNQKNAEGIPTISLIFSADVLKKLNIDYTPLAFPKLEEIK